MLKSFLETRSSTTSQSRSLTMFLSAFFILSRCVLIDLKVYYDIKKTFIVIDIFNLLGNLNVYTFL